jgi:hypothetical protein
MALAASLRFGGNISNDKTRFALKSSDVFTSAFSFFYLQRPLFLCRNNIMKTIL